VGEGFSVMAGRLVSQLWVQILLAMAAGIIVGALFREGGALSGLWEPEAFKATMKLIGDGFIRLIRMLAVPLIFVSVAAAVVSIGDLAKLGTSGARVAALYVPSGLFAATLGVVLAFVLQPGTGMGPPPAGIEVPEPQAPPTAQDILFQFIPGNPVQALAEGQMMSVIVFALLFGLGVLGAREAGRPMADLLQSAAAALMTLVGYIMKLAPLGAFALIAWVVATLGFEALVRLGMLVVCVYAGCFIYGIVVYGGFIKFALGLPLLPFFKGLGEAMAVAYATASSNATLPVTLKCMVERLGISRRMSSFVASMGATVNMDGSAMYIALVTIFGAQMFGITLEAPQIVGIIIAASLGAIGAAGIPGGSLVFIPIVLGIAGVPIEVIGVILAADRLNDMMRTVLNVAGDAVAAVAVAKWEGDFDEQAYRTNTPTADARGEALGAEAEPARSA
jgi:Na+/H+-dicarboxylate symporter